MMGNFQMKKMIFNLILIIMKYTKRKKITPSKKAFNIETKRRRIYFIIVLIITNLITPYSYLTYT